jgi:hypothetical protein
MAPPGTHVTSEMYAAGDIHYPPSGSARAALVLARRRVLKIAFEKTVFIDHLAKSQESHVEH